MQKQRKKTQKERKKKRKRRRRRRDGDQLKTQAGDTGCGRAATQVAPRPSSLRCEPRSLRDCLWFFFFFPSFLLLWWTPSSLISISSSSSSLSFFFSFFLHFLPLFLHFGLHFGSLIFYFWVRNRVLETRFPCRRHLEKVPRKKGTTHKNRA